MLWLLRIKYPKADVSVFLPHSEQFGLYCSWWDTQSLFRVIISWWRISYKPGKYLCALRLFITYLWGGVLGSSCHLIQIRGQKTTGRGHFSSPCGSQGSHSMLSGFMVEPSSTEPSANPNLYAFKQLNVCKCFTSVICHNYWIFHCHVI